jgi:AraC family transcriptional regulator
MSTTRINSLSNSDYISRINRVFDYIDENLNEDLSLTVLAEVAFFSPFHFHRIFRYVTRETVNQYVNRQKIEKAAADLMHTAIGVSEIAEKFGFTSVSSFSRAFKNFYEVSPTEFREQHPHRFSKIRQKDSKNGQEYPSREQYICTMKDLQEWMELNAKIEIIEADELNVGGVTHIGIHTVELGFETLIRWANSQHLMQHPEAKLGRIFYDSVKITPPDQVRQNIFLLTPESFQAEGEIRNIRIFGGQHIVGSYEIAPYEFEKAWTGLFVWMNENGYKKSPENPYEIYHNDFREHPEGKFIVDLYIPIT